MPGPDVVEGGAPPPRRTTRALAVLLAVALAGYAAYAAVGAQTRDSTPPHSRHPRNPPAASKSQAPWPSASWPCGTKALLPIVGSDQPVGHPEGRLLIGGRAQVYVDLSTGDVAGISGMRHGDATVAIRHGPRSTYLLAKRLRHCTYTRSRIYRLSAGSTVTATEISTHGRADDLLAGPNGVWTVRFPRRHPFTGVRLEPLGGGPQVRLNPYPASEAGYPVAATEDGIVVARGDGPHGAPRLLLLYGDGHLRRDYGNAWVYGATPGGTLLLGRGRCDTDRCELSAVDDVTVGGGDQTRGPYSVPAGRRIASDAAIGPSAVQAAMLLSRARPDPRWRLDAGLRPSDVAVLDLDAGGWTIVPGLELPPGATPSLAFDASGTWVLVGVAAGRQVRIYGWRPGMDGVTLLAQALGAPGGAPVMRVLPAR